MSKNVNNEVIEEVKETAQVDENTTVELVAKESKVTKVKNFVKNNKGKALVAVGAVVGFIAGAIVTKGGSEVQDNECEWIEPDEESSEEE